MIGYASNATNEAHTDNTRLKRIHSNLVASTYAPRTSILQVTLTGSHRNIYDPSPKIPLQDLCQDSRVLINL